MNNLRCALNVLSKSSPQAVEIEKEDSFQNRFKDFLYIETVIEKHFARRLTKLKSGEIIFLCGSSGDGKSAILTRYSKEYAGKVRFHLDATHSLDPHNNAICELDKLFYEVNKSKDPLVVGINVGMMGNYAEGGSDDHIEIKKSMDSHIQGTAPPSQHCYFDFEHYPKFEFRDHAAHSRFAEEFMQRLTQQEENPFIELLLKDEEDGQEPILLANFRMLSIPSVQEVIIEALMKARLINDQFMTSRALLDFIHHLLTSPNYLFDNLYSVADNELSLRITGFDPSIIRTKKIDQFILEFNLDLIGFEFKEFCDAIQDLGIINITKADSYIRLFYLFKGYDFRNSNYHHRFEQDFSNSLLEQFARMWKLHDTYSDDSPKEDKIALQDFYNNVLLNGVRRYMNRRAPKLRDGIYFIAEYNKVIVASALKVKLDLNSIAQNRCQHTATFNVFLKVGAKTLPELIVNINLYELLIKLKEGYRPNKHDKSTVLILDELVAQIVEIANQGDTLIFFDGVDQYVIDRDEDDLQVMEV